MKKFKVCIFMLVILLSIALINPSVLAVDENPIYYEDKIIETNDLPGGIKHTKLSGYSQVTNPTLIEKNAKEAGYGSEILLEFNRYYSQQINILEIGNECEVDLVPWGVFENGMWSLAKVVTMAQDYESQHPGKKVVAAINGDFFDINGVNNLRYTPSGSIMVNNELYKVNTSWPMLGINNSGVGDRLVGMGKNTVDVSDNLYLSILNENDEVIKEFEINKINAEPEGDEISIYIPFYNNLHKLEKEQVTDGYIVEKAIDTVAFSKSSVYGKGKISKIGSGEVGQNQFAIKTNNTEVKSYLSENVMIRAQFKILSEQFNNCDNIIGYHDNIMINGEPCYENDGYGNARLPRTLLGTREDGSLIMMVVDGRQASLGYYGICQEETTAIAKHYGIVNGYQMDGGGSATMVVLKNGELQVVNSPSDSQGVTARSDSDCILITVDVPIIEYEIERSFDKVEFTVDVKEMINDYKNLYIEFNGIKKEVIDGKVVFDNLECYTEYVYEFYVLDGEQYKSIAYQGLVTTLKTIPEVVCLKVSIVSEDGVDKYKVEFVIDDPSNSLVYTVLAVNDKTYWPSENVFYYSYTMDNIGMAESWSIELNYNLQSGEGVERININDCPILFESATAMLDCQFKDINKIVNDIFGLE